MTDRNGLTYEAVLEFQRDHLAEWGKKLRPELIQPITDYVVSHNRPANSPEGKHHVWRGQDIIEIIRQWPNLRPPYPCPVTPADLEEV